MEEQLLVLAAAGTEKEGDDGSLVLSEVKKQLRLAGPLVVGCLLQNVVQMISVMFVGHLGELALSGASMATSFANVTGFSLLAGMACSLDTLCGQAFGANQHRMLGVYKQRAMLVLSLTSVPVAALWAYTGQILLLLGQDPEIAAGAGSYIRWMIPALLAYGPLQCHVRFLQTQNIVVPVMLSSGATALNHRAEPSAGVLGAGARARHGEQGRRPRQRRLLPHQPLHPRALRQALAVLLEDLDRVLPRRLPRPHRVPQARRAVRPHGLVRSELSRASLPLHDAVADVKFNCMYVCIFCWVGAQAVKAKDRAFASSLPQDMTT